MCASYWYSFLGLHAPHVRSFVRSLNARCVARADWIGSHRATTGVEHWFSFRRSFLELAGYGRTEKVPFDKDRGFWSLRTCNEPSDETKDAEGAEYILTQKEMIENERKKGGGSLSDGRCGVHWARGAGRGGGSDSDESETGTSGSVSCGRGLMSHRARLCWRMEDFFY